MSAIAVTVWVVQILNTYISQTNVWDVVGPLTIALFQISYTVCQCKKF